MGIALFFVACALLTLFDSSIDDSNAMLGFIMLTCLVGIPGLILCRRANRQYQA